MVLVLVGRRVIQLLGVVIVLVAAMLVVHTSAGARAGGTVAERCALFRTQSQVRERIVTGHGRAIAVLGDSYSVGLGLRKPAGSWPSRLPGRTTVFGFSGSGFSRTASPCRHVAYDERVGGVLASGEHLVVVEGGLNDFDQSDAALRAGFRRLAARLHGRRVLVVGPPAAPARAAGARRVDRVLRAEAARAGMRYLSLVDRRFAYLPDRLHLTPAGHRAFGDAVARSVRAMTR